MFVQGFKLLKRVCFTWAGSFPAGIFPAGMPITQYRMRSYLLSDLCHFRYKDNDGLKFMYNTCHNVSSEWLDQLPEILNVSDESQLKKIIKCVCTFLCKENSSKFHTYYNSMSAC